MMRKLPEKIEELKQQIEKAINYAEEMSKQDTSPSGEEVEKKGGG